MRLPQFLHLTTSKTKQSCETSSFFKLTTAKTKQFCETFFKQWKVQCSADSLVPMRFAIFPLHLSKVLRLPRKSDARSDEVAAAVTQNHLSKPEDRRLQNATALKKSALGPPNSSSLVLRLPRKMHLSRSSSHVPRLPSFLEMPQNPHVFARSRQGPQSLAPATRNDI